MPVSKPKNLLVRNRSSQSSAVTSTSSPIRQQSPPSTSQSQQGLLLSPPLSAHTSDSLLSPSSRPRDSEEDAAFGGFGAGGSRSGDVYEGRGSRDGSSEEGGGGVLMSPNMSAVGSPRRISGGSVSLACSNPHKPYCEELVGLKQEEEHERES